MKQVWVKIDPWDKKRVTTALEGGADAVWTPPGHAAEVKALGKITVIAPDGDLVPGEDLCEITLESSADEAAIVSQTKSRPVIIRCTDWTIIPLENLIAQASQNLFVEAATVEEVKTFLGILERGVDGLVITAPHLGELKKLLALAKGISPPVELTTASVIGVKPLGMGDRVCVDTCTQMGLGQGMLVGNSSAALFLVHAESLENPYVAARPFRVNAGPVHAYIRVPGNKTRYLSELTAGDEVLVVDHQGQTLPATVGRVKIEKRPLMLVTAAHAGKEFATIVQNAETIRLTRPNGEAVSVVHLAPGDEILVALEEAGRHFGYKVTETILEK
ncbi:MAG: 3-dehydroquinate synthase II [Desulfobacterota bacterium]|jgi:3-dehydroquinate synthase II|nr:3-dehydroquinate synthase II [Thermodesulfobacteriota bacterium]